MSGSPGSSSSNHAPLPVQFHATVAWRRRDAAFIDSRYSRAHAWEFDGGIRVPASASPLSVPLPYSDPAAVDPEEAFVASISSCHMLWFLALAAKQGFVVESYDDAASGVMGPNEDGRKAMLEVVLRPAVRFAEGHAPTAEQLHALHHAAHETCYIANSVRTRVRCEPVI